MLESGPSFLGEQEEPIKPRPRLRYILRSLELLRPEGGPMGAELNWKELYRKVKPWNNAIELSDNVRGLLGITQPQKLQNLKNLRRVLPN